MLYSAFAEKIGEIEQEIEECGLDLDSMEIEFQGLSPNQSVKKIDWEIFGNKICIYWVFK